MSAGQVLVRLNWIYPFYPWCALLSPASSGGVVEGLEQAVVVLGICFAGRHCSRTAASLAEALFLTALWVPDEPSSVRAGR